jgi:hypothetical protein
MPAKGDFLALVVEALSRCVLRMDSQRNDRPSGDVTEAARIEKTPGQKELTDATRA